MASKVEGITVVLGADTNGITKSLKDVNKDLSSTQRELRNVQNLLKLDPSNTELLERKQKLLGEQVETTKSKLSALTEAQKKMVAEQGNVDSKEFRDLQDEIVKTKNKLEGYEDQLKNCNVTLEKMGVHVEAFSKKTGELGNAMLPVTAAMAGIAAGSIAAMNAVDEGLDRVMTATGATGEQAKQLQTVYENVVQQIPDDFANIGGAVGELNTRLGLNGDELENASILALQFSKINGVDVVSGIQSVTRMMKNADIPTEDYGKTLDMLSKAAQISGKDVLSLADSYTKNGAALKELGFVNDEAIGMLAKWEVEGVNVESALAGMKKAVVSFTNDGKDAKVEIVNVVNEIKALSDTGNDVDAISLAMETFGNKAGPELKDAIAQGKFEYQDFIQELANSQGTLEGTYGMIVDEVDDTQLASQTFQLALHDLGEIISKTVGPILKDLADKFKALMDRFNGMPKSTQKIIVLIGGIVAAIGPALIAVSGLSGMFGKLIKGITPLINTIFPSLAGAISLPAAPILAIMAAIGALVAAFVYLWTTNEEFRDNILQLWELIQQRIGEILQFIQDNFSFVFDGIKVIIDTALNIIMDLVEVFIALFSGDWEGLWVALQKLVSDITNGICKFFSVMFDGIMEIFGKIVQWIVEKIQSIIDEIVGFASKFLDAGKKLFQNVWDGMKSIWTNLSTWVSEKVEWLLGKLMFWRSANDEMAGGSGSKSQRDADGSHANGLWNVPFDGYRAIVHKGEMIVPAKQAEGIRNGSGKSKGDINVTQNIYTDKLDEAGMARKTARELKKLALGV